ncbi:MAG: chromate transporter [Oceanospirillaceae bacterium]|nr:chromate transporter [Oceanospirillaceae bacterium]
MIEIYGQLFLAFFIPNVIGYGGGPAIIPLIEIEVVSHYGWLDIQQFSETLALGNALPSPIATKMAGHIGYSVAGIPGAFIAVFATVAPSLLLMITLLSILQRYKDSIKVKSMTLLVRPVIAVMMAILTYKLLQNSYFDAGIYHSAGLIIAAYLLLERFKIHPALVISGALAYGGVFLG